GGARQPGARRSAHAAARVPEEFHDLPRRVARRLRQIGGGLPPDPHGRTGGEGVGRLFDEAAAAEVKCSPGCAAVGRGLYAATPKGGSRSIGAPEGGDGIKPRVQRSATRGAPRRAPCFSRSEGIMDFGVWAMLFGLFAVAIPPIIHLLNRRRY